MLVAVILSSICCVLMLIVSAAAGIGYKESQAKYWRCVKFSDDSPQYVIGRFNKGEAECMYNPNAVGCYVVTPQLDSDDVVDQSDLADQCANAISTYPNTKTPSGVVNMEAYRCGRGGDNEKLWGNTGYTTKNDMCYKILDNTGMKFLKTFQM